ncbi:hypothetical protein GGR57DRAFT_506041 [Xylariaceae sp. FL1272]|nr:hypothetical protein GGR57DRAFT_506041 [Xylariaceae sp. FL1272]
MDYGINGFQKLISPLSQATTDAKTPHVLPSWVPDWRRRFKKDYQTFPLVKLNYDAGSITPSDTPKINIQNNVRWPQVREDWMELNKYMQSHSRRYPSMQLLREAFKSTLYCYKHELQDQRDGCSQYFDLATGSDNQLSTRKQLTEPERNFGDAGRQFFGTTNGYMGRGLDSVQRGDIVGVFIGAKVPFVLRPTADNDGLYLVGECYVHGIMHGEAFRDTSLQRTTGVKDPDADHGGRGRGTSDEASTASYYGYLLFSFSTLDGEEKLQVDEELILTMENALEDNEGHGAKKLVAFLRQL